MAPTNDHTDAVADTVRPVAGTATVAAEAVADRVKVRREPGVAVASHDGGSSVDERLD